MSSMSNLPRSIRGVTTFGEGDDVQNVRADRHSALSEFDVERGRFDLTHGTAERAENELVLR